MSKEPHNIDRLIREKLDGFEMTPPPSVWENTAASLNGGKKKRFFLWFTLVFVLLAVGASGIYFFSTQSESTKELAVNGASTKEEANNSSQSEVRSGLNSEKYSTTSSNRSSNTDITSETLSKGNETASNSFRSRPVIDEVNTDRDNSSFDKKIGDKFTADKNDAQKNRNLQGNSADRGAVNDHHTKKDRNQKDTTVNLDPDGSKSAVDSEEQNDLPNSTVTEETVNLGSLPLLPAGQFEAERASIVQHSNESWPMRPIPPFRKAFSLEAAAGISTFHNYAKKSTPPNLLNALNAAASREQSLDFRFGVNYHFSNRFSLQSGIHYNSSKENYSFEVDQMVTTTVLDTISFTVDSTTMDTTFMIDTNFMYSTVTTNNTVENRYRLVTIPFQFAWNRPISTKGTLELALGGAISIFGRNSGSLIASDSSVVIGAESGYETTGLLSLGGSIKYLHRFGNHHSVYIEPWAQFGITNQSTSALNYESLRRRYGIRVGYRFYF